ncbi:MAG: Fis family transcriptional regulator [Acidobacteria bacterium]|jgi:two-component system nitrogen regulation response regulator NtrX|nr:Fis family transcriptional regulator [Acidobacteriota bacterium]MDP7479898.1 sigma-54 dependent transcriptional regulator [Vicinamibacterales bacterium]HJN45953.1 sigma-54 dependent transcriptional regulator [Vicinamibacterales bacterium]
MNARVLVVDDEEAIRSTMKQAIDYAGHDCLLARSGQEGLGMVERESPDVVFLDIKMPGMDGLEVLKRIREIDESVEVVIISGHGTMETGREATKLGAFSCLTKPIETGDILLNIRNALEQRRLKTEVTSYRKLAEVRHEMVGESPALVQVADAIGRAAPTNSTVLIQGESGVGKELVARAIHRNSRRGKERFVQVNCAALPEELIESELFGHERGAFTGATQKQIGKFEQADRGTIFLDEVGDMSLRTQAKVLRVLQEGEVERLGSARTIKVDARVIAATNRNLEEAIDNGTFREDLYFRLSVIPIQVPPLRDRGEDISRLVAHFTDLFCTENNFRPKRFTPAAIDLMTRERWRGNVRELRNTVERLMVMTPGETIDTAEAREVLPSDARGGAGEVAANLAGTLREFKEVAERAFLVEKLREHSWNISKTAEVIDTPRSNLYKKLEQYQIKQEQDA